MKHLILTLGILLTNHINATVTLKQQAEAAATTVSRIVGPEHTGSFKIEIIPQENKLDVFEVESVDGKIVLRGSNGVTACRALKWYLNNKCNSSLSWHGDNLKLPAKLPTLGKKFRSATKHKYRYIFNFCTYGYSMPWWKWEDWERTLDFLAFNGINLPLCPLGQEKVWQETYKEFGLTKEDMSKFFASPPWQPWQWMSNLDDHGGPIPQSVIDGQAELQKKILARARSLGMTPVLMGFNGHVPKAFKKKYPKLKIHTMEWQGFHNINTLDPNDPMFIKLGAAFIKKQTEIFGTDHYYAIDPFNEMIPPSDDPVYRAGMAKRIFQSMDQGDPKGTWVLQTWFCKEPHVPGHPWPYEATKGFFDAIPDDRLLALELHGENWFYTGWRNQNGWFNKPWVWSAIQSFGDQVDIYGGLTHIFNNYNRMLQSPEKGNPVGMGIMMEGLCYNPVVFELLFDMMWGDGVTDLQAWQQQYVLKRYGKSNKNVARAWDILFATRYTRHKRTGGSPLVGGFGLWGDHGPDMDIVTAWKLMVSAADEFKDNPAFHFDLVNLGREAMGHNVTHYTAKVKKAYDAKDLDALRKANTELIQYIRDYDALMASSEHFLLGKWIAGARSWGANKKESDHLEWCAKKQITNWGGHIGAYAVKEWSGIVGDRSLPLAINYTQALEHHLATGSDEKLKQHRAFSNKHLRDWEHSQRKNLPSTAQGDPIALSKAAWKKWGTVMHAKGASGYTPPTKPTPKGIAVNMPTTASNENKNQPAKLATDGDASSLNSCWWAEGPASLTVDLKKTQRVLGFQVYPYWDGKRHYQYTIETSEDGKTWGQVIDMSENKETATPRGHLHNFKLIMPTGVKCRYVRLNMLKNSANEGVHVVEFKVFDATAELFDAAQ